jgi:hypothetical protein
MYNMNNEKNRILYIYLVKDLLPSKLLLNNLTIGGNIFDEILDRFKTTNQKNDVNKIDEGGVGTVYKYTDRSDNYVVKSFKTFNRYLKESSFGDKHKDKLQCNILYPLAADESDMNILYYYEG